MQKLSFTWLGHATFTLRTPGGKRIIMDPWVSTNPMCPESARQVGALDLMLITHGHGDHTADAISIGRSSGAHGVAAEARAAARDRDESGRDASHARPVHHHGTGRP